MRLLHLVSDGTSLSLPLLNTIKTPLNQRQQ